MLPDPSLLEDAVASNGMEATLRARLLSFYRWLLRRPNLYARIGHAFFLRATDEESLRRLWRLQLQWVLEKAYAIDQAGFREVTDAWERVFLTHGAQPAASEDEAGQSAG
jgi:hypothetical protein